MHRAIVVVNARFAKCAAMGVVRKSVEAYWVRKELGSLRRSRKHRCMNAKVKTGCVRL
jgi:hypothetical protein